MIDYVPSVDFDNNYSNGKLITLKFGSISFLFLAILIPLSTILWDPPLEGHTFGNSILIGIFLFGSIAMIHVYRNTKRFKSAFNDGFEIEMKLLDGSMKPVMEKDFIEGSSKYYKSVKKFRYFYYWPNLSELDVYIINNDKDQLIAFDLVNWRLYGTKQLHNQENKIRNIMEKSFCRITFK